MRQAKWRNQNSFELKKEGSSMIMTKFKKKQLWLKLTGNFKNYPIAQKERDNRRNKTCNIDI